jgi:hypothetical protein
MVEVSLWIPDKEVTTEDNFFSYDLDARWRLIFGILKGLNKKLEFCFSGMV